MLGTRRLIFWCMHVVLAAAAAAAITSGPTKDNKASRVTHIQARQLRFTGDLRQH